MFSEVNHHKFTLSSSYSSNNSNYSCLGGAIKQVQDILLGGGEITGGGFDYRMQLLRHSKSKYGEVQIFGALAPISL